MALPPQTNPLCLGASIRYSAPIMTDSTATPAASSAPQAKQWIQDIAPYVPGKAKSDDGRALIKLSANENPLGTSAKARAAFEAAEQDLARYPDPGATGLREALAAKYGLDPARIIYGTGSDELLHMAASAFAGPGDEIIFMQYGFAVYEIATRRVGATPVEVPAKDYATDVDGLLAAVTERTKVVYVANPNNPTGTLASRADIARLQAGLRPDILFVLDQAYAEFLTQDEDDDGLALAETKPNVLVTRTFSKIYGLAAERIGWGYASADIIAMLHRIRAPFNVTTCGQAAAVAALGDDEFVDASRAHNAEWLGFLAQEMEALGNQGVRVVPSACNFLLVLFEGDVSAENVYNGLMQRGYIVRWLPGQGLGQGLRITIGTEDETRGVASAIRDLVTGG